MHMADALLSPAVGGTMWAATAGLIGFSSKKVKEELDDKKIPLMGVMGAFIFAAQMINFSIPGTGSSGHIGGGILLAIILGPYSAFLTIASVLIIQAFFFADGGLLALGSNIFNLGFFPCFIAYPLIYKKIVRDNPSGAKIVTASIIATVVALQLGAFGVVLETSFSGISELPLATFTILMQPIHLAIGLVEGVATAAVVFFIWKWYPEISQAAMESKPIAQIPLKKVLISLLVVTVIIGGVFSWFASSHPDGLEWSIFKTAGVEELKPPEAGVHTALTDIQEMTALLPDYNFREESAPAVGESGPDKAEPWPSVSMGTTLAGIIGGVLTLILAGIIGFILKRRKTAVQNT